MFVTTGTPMSITEMSANQDPACNASSLHVAMPVHVGSGVRETRNKKGTSSSLVRVQELEPGHTRCRQEEMTHFHMPTICPIICKCIRGIDCANTLLMSVSFSVNSAFNTKTSGIAQPICPPPCHTCVAAQSHTLPVFVTIHTHTSPYGTALNPSHCQMFTIKTSLRHDAASQGPAHSAAKPVQMQMGSASRPKIDMAIVKIGSRT